MTIEEHFNIVQKLLEDYKSYMSELDKIETHFVSMMTQPSSYFGLPCPISNLTCLTFYKVSVKDKISMSIYNELEALYTGIVINFDSSFVDPKIRNIRIDKVVNKVLCNSPLGGKFKNDDRKEKMESIALSPLFDHSISPSYSIIYNFIEWRGANTHFTTGITQVNLDEIYNSFITHKDELISLHKKLEEYLLNLKNNVPVGLF